MENPEANNLIKEEPKPEVKETVKEAEKEVKQEIKAEAKEITKQAKKENWTSEELISAISQMIDDKLTKFRADFINDIYEKETNMTKPADNPINKPTEAKPKRRIFGFNLD